DSLKQHVTHFAQDLSEAKHQERVSVAGIVTKIRQHQTKNGKPMAFATIEDVQGMIDLVLFPNTWKQFGEMVRFDEIIYVKGKADANGGDTKVLVDKVTTSLNQIESVPDTPRSRTMPVDQEPTPRKKEPVQTVAASQTSMDPPPEVPPLTEENPIVDSDVDMELAPPLEIPPLETQVEKPDPKETEKPVEYVQDPSPVPEKVGVITLEEDSTYLVTVILKNRGDTMRDKLRLRQVYGTLISYPGKDRFAFQIIENDQAHLLEFPNASTKISKNLINQLKDMVGRENVQVEKYLF
ncbi:MAG: hypothetical protein HQ574_00120, partial [Chloroflexi bacterium]|nr:hypothetical protein [Chloroflexota bacterium]